MRKLLARQAVMRRSRRNDNGIDRYKRRDGQKRQRNLQRGPPTYLHFHKLLEHRTMERLDRIQQAAKAGRKKEADHLGKPNLALGDRRPVRFVKMELDTSAAVEHIQLHALHGLVADLYGAHPWLESIPAGNRMSHAHDSLRQAVHRFERHLLAHPVNDPHRSFLLRDSACRNSFNQCFDSLNRLRGLCRFPG